MVSIDDFKKIEMKIGKIVSVERVPDTDKLLKLSVDFGLRTPELQPTVSDGSLKEEGLQPSRPSVMFGKLFLVLRDSLKTLKCS